MKILLTGGGTGGHIYPALAIAEELRRRHPQIEILYVGTNRGLESKIVPARGIRLKTISVEGFPRKIGVKLAKAGLKAVKGSIEARNVVKEFQPDVVLGTGGYVCGPVVMQAHLLHIPTIIHEQNALPGATNKILSKMVDQVMVNFDASRQYFKNQEKIVVTGLPVREEVLQTKKQEGLAFFGLQEEKVTLLVSGGSRGAKSINDAMVEAYPHLLQQSQLQIIHSTGSSGYEQTLQNLQKKGIRAEEYADRLRILPYIEQMQYALAAADLTLARAGATNLAEITACGLPAILVPYPYASENHQEYNARSLAEKNAAIMILDHELNAESLIKKIEVLLSDQTLRENMAQASLKMGNPNSLDQIVKLIEKYLK